MVLGVCIKNAFLIFVGRRFAEQEMYVVIMKFLQNYRMEWPHQEEMKQIYSVTLAPSMPAKIHFHLRKMQA